MGRPISSSEVGRKVEIESTEVEDGLTGCTRDDYGRLNRTDLLKTSMKARVSEQRRGVKGAKQRSKEVFLLHGMAYDG